MEEAAISYSLKTYVVGIILTAFALRLLMNRYKHGLQDIPGPRIAKYTGLWKLHNVWKGDHHNTAIDLHQKHGNLVRIGPRHVSVGDPSAIPVIYGLNKGFTKVCICPRVFLETWIASSTPPPSSRPETSVGEYG